ncbi:hypothetical protein KC19_N000400 [Ceratodon purpureus]|nr:hypothetical protein KC19_N000400 [Ceratodon purpureus]
MSAATAPATATGNALSGGVAPEKVSAKPRKRTTVSKGTSESTEVPLLTTTNAAAVTRGRRAREPRMTLDEGMGLAFSRDLTVVDEGEATAPRENNTPLSTPTHKQSNLDIASGKVSPVKHKAVKHVTHKVKEKKRTLWDTMGHLFSPLFLLFIVGAGLGTTVWNMRPMPTGPIWDVSSGEVEKLEEFVTKTTKWMQVQLEVLDMKIDKEISETREEFKQKLDLKAAEIASGVKGLQTQLDHLYENGVPLNRNEVMELVKNVVEQRASESTSKSFSLEDVRSIARKIVLGEVEKHAADGIGRTDYALASGGGRVIDHSEGFFVGKNRQWSTMAFSTILPGATRKHPLAQKVLEPSFGEPGQCLPLKGSNVYVEIALRTSIRPDAVTLEHVSKVKHPPSL